MLERKPFDAVLPDELNALRKRRAAVLGCVEPEPAAGETGSEQALRFRPVGMCLSGGGIRSATYNLGVLQGLAKQGLLPYIDYLSTVSGGGYIGSWLHRVIERYCDRDPRKLVPSVEDSPILRRQPGPPEKDPVTYLRNYSNYLAPRTGLLGADAWVVITIWMRNMLLNQSILVPFLAAVVALALLLASSFRLTPDPSSATVISILAFAALGVAVWTSASNLRDIVARQFGPDSAEPPPDRRVMPTVLGAVAGSALLFSLHWSPVEPLMEGTPWVQPWLVGLAASYVLHLLLQGLGGFWQCYQAQHHSIAGGIAHMLWMPVVAAAITTAQVCVALWLIARSEPAWHAVIWGAPLLMLALIHGVTMHIGLMGRDFPDGSREWLARVGGVLGSYGVMWLALMTISIYGPYAVALLALKYGAVAATGFAAWAGTSWFGVRAGNSPSSGEPGSVAGGFKGWLLRLAPAVFLVGFLVFIATGVHLTLGVITGAHGEPVAEQSVVEARAADRGRAVVDIYTARDRMLEEFNRRFQGLAPFVADYHAVLNDIHFWPGCAGILFVAGLIAGLLPLRVNINEFSMHHFYKNRLVRCYLGAGNADRHPNSFTGFDPKDDIPIARFDARAEKPYYGPYPILNTALNLSADSELAKQERKASSFVFTPKYCGFDVLQGPEAAGAPMYPDGYVETQAFTAEGGPSIGTAMAISGAAANPNGGYHTSAAVAFLLTIFNVRLGWWVGNPRRKTSWGDEPAQRPGPHYGLMWLLWELIGKTTARSKYVNLSDGGHFENLGLYELVRRRCRYVIVSDGEEDPSYTFNSLGGAIRKCRADFGVDIDIDTSAIGSTGRNHCVVGTITYPELDPATGRRATGCLLYLKASLTGDEPQDVRQYHAAHPAFPQQPTADQFFSESQFESYRALGFHIVSSAMENSAVDLAAPLAAGSQNTPEFIHQTLDALFDSLVATWYADPTASEEARTRLNDAFTSLVARLTSEPELAFLVPALLDGAGELPPPADAPAQLKAALFSRDAFQLIENVWDIYRLSAASNRANPKNGGWMAVIRRWACTPYMATSWDRIQGDYNVLFRSFIAGLQSGQRAKGASGSL